LRWRASGKSKLNGTRQEDLTPKRKGESKEQVGASKKRGWGTSVAPLREEKFAGFSSVIDGLPRTVNPSYVK
jgi:hypothetical protein